MQSSFVVIEQSNILQFCDLYIAVFNAAPWHDGWTPEAVRERFESFACYPTFYGIAHFTNRKPDAIAFGWTERWINKWHFHLKEMCVAPDAQGRGIGSNVLSELEVRLRNRDVDRIFLETGQSAPARKFYEASGYKQNSLVSLAKKIEA